MTIDPNLKAQIDYSSDICATITLWCVLLAIGAGILLGFHQPVIAILLFGIGQAIYFVVAYNTIPAAIRFTAASLHTFTNLVVTGVLGAIAWGLTAGIMSLTGHSAQLVQ
jgi:hypothetical protein